MAFVVKNEKENEKGILFKASSSQNNTSNPFISQKESVTSKNEGIIKSKFAKAVIGFSKGFAVGYIPAADMFNPSHPYYERIVLGSAFAFGVIGAFREMYCSKEEKQKDNEAFIRPTVGTGIFLYTMTGFGFLYESLAIGSVFGIASVIKRRIKERKEKRNENKEM